MTGKPCVPPLACGVSLSWSPRPRAPVWLPFDDDAWWIRWFAAVSEVGSALLAVGDRRRRSWNTGFTKSAGIRGDGDPAYGPPLVAGSCPIITMNWASGSPISSWSSPRALQSRSLITACQAQKFAAGSRRRGAFQPKRFRKRVHHLLRGLPRRWRSDALFRSVLRYESPL